MVNSGNVSENCREVNNAIAFRSDGNEEEQEEEVRWLCLGCAGEEAINFKRRGYVEELENLLKNQVLKCEEEAYKLYCDYAYAVGFSVRKGKQYYFPGTNRIRAKWYCCSKEGFSYDKDDGSSSNSNKLETRTGCKAMIYFVCDNEGQWTASKFVKEHNHEMAELSERQFLRSARAILASNSATTAPMMSKKQRKSTSLNFLSLLSMHETQNGSTKADIRAYAENDFVDIPNTGYEVESSVDVIYFDGDEEDEVMCLRCIGGEDTTLDEDPLDGDTDNLEKKLLAEVVNNEEEAYKLYCEYAHVVGFSVRKGKQYYFPGTKRIRSKTYFCSKEGFMNEDISVATHNKLEARTGCKAMISFTCDNDGKWKVTKFLKDHNHKMAEPYERHLLRSARSNSDSAKGNITSQSMILDLNKGVAKAGSSGGVSVANGHTLLEPQEGMVFQSEDAAMSFYAEYARKLGFLINVMPCCPPEVDGSSDLSSVENQQLSLSSECQAMILLECEKSGKCIVSKFLRDHSHPLVIFPEELGHTMDEKDRKIQELKTELQNKRRLCGMYREHLVAVVKVVEEHTREISKRVDLVVNNVRAIS